MPHPLFHTLQSTLDEFLLPPPSPPVLLLSGKHFLPSPMTVRAAKMNPVESNPTQFPFLRDSRKLTPLVSVMPPTCHFSSPASRLGGWPMDTTAHSASSGKHGGGRTLNLLGGLVVSAGISPLLLTEKLKGVSQTLPQNIEAVPLTPVLGESLARRGLPPILAPSWLPSPAPGPVAPSHTGSLLRIPASAGPVF